VHLVAYPTNPNTGGSSSSFRETSGGAGMKQAKDDSLRGQESPMDTEADSW